MLSGLYLTKFMSCDSSGNLDVRIFIKNQESAENDVGSIFGRIYL
jgi:hypothetical protein